MKCAGCGSDNRDGVRFCETCGVVLTVETGKAQGPVCPTCNSVNRVGVHFCEVCDAVLIAAAVPADPVKVKFGLTCPHCRKVNGPGVPFCEICGAALTVAAGPAKPVEVRLVEMITGPTCPSCQSVNRVGIRFCEICGTELEGQQVVLPPPRHRSLRMRGWGILAAVAGLIIVALAVAWVISQFQPPVSRGEASRMAESIVERDFANLVDVEPALQRYQGAEGPVYSIDYVTDVIVETDNGEVTVSTGVVVTVNQHTGETEIISVR